MLDYIKQILAIIGSVPRPVWAVAAGCILPVAFLWRLEYSLPDKMGALWMRFLLLFGSIFLGPLACCLVWWSLAGVVPGFIGGLLSEGGRQLLLWYLAKRFPGLTSIPKLTVKMEPNGDVGLKVGDDPTLMLTEEQKRAIANTIPPKQP